MQKVDSKPKMKGRFGIVSGSTQMLKTNGVMVQSRQHRDYGMAALFSGNGVGSIPRDSTDRFRKVAGYG